MVFANPYTIAERYIGLKELKDQGKDHPFIQWCFTLCGYGTDTQDEVPWCSAFMQHPAWELRLPRSKSAAARSWLTVGNPIMLSEARRPIDADGGFDIVIFTRAGGSRDPNVLTGPGHVALFSWLDTDGAHVSVLGGNQGDEVKVSRFPVRDIIGLRRLG